MWELVWGGSYNSNSVDEDATGVTGLLSGQQGQLQVQLLGLDAWMSERQMPEYTEMTGEIRCSGWECIFTGRGSRHVSRGIEVLVSDLVVM